MGNLASSLFTAVTSPKAVDAPRQQGHTAPEPQPPASDTATAMEIQTTISKRGRQQTCAPTPNHATRKSARLASRAVGPRATQAAAARLRPALRTNREGRSVTPPRVQAEDHPAARRKVRFDIPEQRQQQQQEPPRQPSNTQPAAMEPPTDPSLPPPPPLPAGVGAAAPVAGGLIPAACMPQPMPPAPAMMYTPTTALPPGLTMSPAPMQMTMSPAPMQMFSAPLAPSMMPPGLAPTPLAMPTMTAAPGAVYSPQSVPMHPGLTPTPTQMQVPGTQLIYTTAAPAQPFPGGPLSGQPAQWAAAGPGGWHQAQQWAYAM